MDLISLRTLFFKWLPAFLSVLVLMGLVILFVQKILPNWKDYQTLSDNITEQHAVINTQAAAQNDNDNQVILQHLIDDTEKKLNVVSDSFLTQLEAEQVLNRVYSYAYSRGARITSLEAQRPTPSTDLTDTAPYTANLFQLQVTGGVTNLIDFISRFREASLPGVNIVNMSVAQLDNEEQLTMMLQIYTSPYASGQALNQLPTLAPLDPVTPTLTLMPSATTTPTSIPATATVASATPTSTPSPTPTFTATLVPTFTPTFTATVTAITPSAATETAIICVGAQPTRFKIGDIAIVHFSGVGALRLLSDPNGSVMSTRTQAYDKQHLEIIAGPVCANNSFYWYIRNLSQNDALGWVAEGKGDERWLCPELDPVCTV